MRVARVAWVSLVLVASSAWAQKVVVLELDGDMNNRLHAQIEGAIRKAGAVELVSLEKYKENAAKKRLNGGAAMTPVGVTRTAKLMKLDAAVAGEVSGNTYKVVIYDALGQELWTKSLPLKRGVLSDDFSVKLARAIAAAAEQGAARANVTPNASDDPGATAPPTSTPPVTENEGLDLTDTGPTSGAKPAAASTVVEDPARDADLDAESVAKRHGHFGPQVFRAKAGIAMTWRAQCLRPGPTTLTSCKAYDAITPKPLGIQIDFAGSVPYAGFNGDVEIFPFARFEPGSEYANRAIQAIGVVGNFGYGVSTTKIVEATDQGTGPEKIIQSTDLAWAVRLAYRYHFGMGLGDPQGTGYAGLHAGLQGRSFNIDPNAGVSLPSSQRTFFTALGFEGALPIARFFRIEASVSLFLAPKVGADQIAGYGNATDITGGVVSSGFGFEAGFAGEIIGPLGYHVRAKYNSFHDQYYGQGRKWTVCNESQCGGVGEETYTSILVSLTGSF
jgi:hypothetical protein